MSKDNIMHLANGILANPNCAGWTPEEIVKRARDVSKLIASEPDTDITPSLASPTESPTGSSTG